MKKTLPTVVLIIVLVAVLVLAGFSFVKPNEEREANQILQTVSKYGITLTTSQSEMMDYINSNASSLIQNYNFSVEEAIRYLSDRKAETKLLTIEGLNYLKNDLSAAAAEKRRANLISGVNAKYDGILTWGEYYSAIKSVNDSIQTQVETLEKEYKTSQKKKDVNKASTKDIEKIEFVETSLKKEYLKGDTLDTDALQIRIVYMDGAAQSETIIPVTDSMITTAFDSSAVAEEKTLVVTFTANNKVRNDDGEYEYQAIDLTAEWTYEVKKAPTVRAEDPDETEDSVVGRYSSKAEIAAEYASEKQNLSEAYYNNYMDADGLPKKLDLAAKVASSADAEKYAYRQLLSRFESAYRSMDYFYENALENQVLSVLQWELQQSALSDKGDDFWDSEVMKQFNYLTASSAASYDTMSRKEQKAAFITAIGSALTSLYYIPKVYDAAGNENLQDYAWVSQILFSFTDEQKAWLTAHGSTDEAYRILMSHMEVDEANPKYEANHEHDKYCEENCNRDVPYLNYGQKVFQDIVNEDGSVTLSVYSKLCLELEAAQKENKDVLKVFEDYLYRYNSDDGIFNNNLGYLITPKDEQTSWVDSFAQLGRDLVQNSKGANGMPTVGYYYEGKADTAKTWEYKTANGGSATVPKVASCNSTYGIHLMMIKFTPFNDVMLNKADYAYGNGYRFNVNTALTDINRETEKPSNTTFLKTLKDNSKTEIKTEAYNSFIEEFITDENKESEATSIVVDEKKLSALIKKYTN